MRLRLLTFVAFLGLILPGAFAHAAPTAADDKAMQAVLTALVDAVNDGDTDAAIALISPNSPELREEVRTALAAGNLTYNLDCIPWDSRRDEIADGAVVVSCTYGVEGENLTTGMNWSASGLSTDFVFLKNAAGDWMIVDSGFARALMPSAAFAVMGKIALIAVALCFLIFGFWLWMLIDCARRDFKDKVVWVLLLIFLAPFSAVLYYFIVKRKDAKGVR